MSLELNNMGHNEHVDITTAARGAAVPTLTVDIKVGAQHESQDASISFSCDARGRMSSGDNARLNELLTVLVGPHMSAAELLAVQGIISARHGALVVGVSE